MNWSDIQKRFDEMEGRFIKTFMPYKDKKLAYAADKLKAFLKKELDAAYKEGQLDAAREIGLATAQAGIDIIKLDSVKDWQRVIKKIQKNVLLKDKLKRLAGREVV